MKAVEAKVIISNLLERIVEDDRGRYTLPGLLTSKELSSLQLAIISLDSSEVAFIIPEPDIEETSKTSSAEETKFEESLADVVKEHPNEITSHPSVKLDVLKYPIEETKIRVCLDFGTAMSKATLVADETGSEPERIEVLELGIPGDQPEVSDHMLVSSVYISDDGELWFGQYAVAQSQNECLGNLRLSYQMRSNFVVLS
ncbi:hypothetical protein [uncultured Amphritea sp.]|uniref:hypothetical protein n=1 Tax=uncultured Amphritea sp. TaxID=981605 RepID=UPI002622D722|nr:hypothetical protein [uncultured Amphritea sp.]